MSTHNRREEDRRAAFSRHDDQVGTEPEQATSGLARRPDRLLELVREKLSDLNLALYAGRNQGCGDGVRGRSELLGDDRRHYS